jgi:hypothetical protein
MDLQCCSRRMWVQVTAAAAALLEATRVQGSECQRLARRPHLQHQQQSSPSPSPSPCCCTTHVLQADVAVREVGVEVLERLPAVLLGQGGRQVVDVSRPGMTRLVRSLLLLHGDA